MNSREEWHKLILSSPLDRDLQRAYSDWLEEQGDLPHAEAWRWIVREDKQPRAAGANYLQSQVSYDWWKEETFNHKMHIVPHPLFRRLTGLPPGRSPENYKEYISLGDALLDLAHVKATEGRDD